MQSSLRNNGLRNKKKYEETNPLEGVVNIVDAMLVFACGLMLSLVINWNVDIGQHEDSVNLTEGQEVSDVQDIQDIKDNLSESETKGDIYEKLGTVYKDPKTGKLFMITDNG